MGIMRLNQTYLFKSEEMKTLVTVPSLPSSVLGSETEQILYLIHFAWMATLGCSLKMIRLLVWATLKEMYFI